MPLLHQCESRLASGIAVLVLSVFNCVGHPDLVEQITAVTKKIGEQGEWREGYLMRADLFRRHGQFDAALADLESAARLQTNGSPLLLERARVLCDAGRAAESFEKIETFLKYEPSHVEGLIIRARCHAQLDRAEAAIIDYSDAIVRAPAPGPDLFLARAKQQAKLGKLAEAARGLDEAITNSTMASPLQLTAIAYDRQRAAFDSALARVDKLVASYPVKEPWWTLRAEILEQAGRIKEAEQTFKHVIVALEKYSPLRRALDLTQKLETRAREGLARTQHKSTLSP